jgi:hypothetical protein
MSKALTVSIPHNLGVTEARKRLEQGLAGLGDQIPGGMSHVRQSWDGNRLNFAADAMGQTISGWLDIYEDVVNMELNLPGLLGMIAGTIKGKVEQQGRLLLEKK